MLRTLVKVGFVVLFIGFISTQLFAQAFTPTNNIGQHIVGTWSNVEIPNEILVINANGTGTWDGDVFRWVVIGSKIAFVFVGDETYLDNIIISNDGRFLILSEGKEGFLFQKR